MSPLAAINEVGGEKPPVWQHTPSSSLPPAPLPFLSTFVSRAFDNYIARGQLNITTDFPKHDALKKYQKVGLRYAVCPHASTSTQIFPI